MNTGLSQHRIVSALLTGMHRPSGEPERARLSLVNPDSAIAAPKAQQRFGPRDGAIRVVAAAAMDPQNRVCLTKVAAAAGWASDTPLVVTCLAGEVRVAPGVQEHPAQIPARYTDGRLTLPATVRAVLQLVPGEAVIATTVPGSAEVVLVAAADVGQDLSGYVAPATAPATASPESAPRRTTVRPAFRSAAPAVRVGD